ncbi:hypothetical protein ACFVHQ_00380 [Actinomycetes bacterium NPDC127524]
MQRTIFDFLYKKYDFDTKSGLFFRDTFTKRMKLYWSLKLTAVLIYFILFLKFVGKDSTFPAETYWFVGSMAAGLLLISLSYLNVALAWFAISLGQHRKWIDSLLIISGLLLCLPLPVYSYHESGFDLTSLRQVLMIAGIFMGVIGLYRKIHYLKRKVVPFSAAASLLIFICIFTVFNVSEIKDSIYLGFLTLVNMGFLADMIVYYYLHQRVNKGISSNKSIQV